MSRKNIREKKFTRKNLRWKILRQNKFSREKSRSEVLDPRPRPEAGTRLESPWPPASGGYPRSSLSPNNCDSTFSPTYALCICRGKSAIQGVMPSVYRQDSANRQNPLLFLCSFGRSAPIIQSSLCSEWVFVFLSIQIFRQFCWPFTRPPNQNPKPSSLLFRTVHAALSCFEGIFLGQSVRVCMYLPQNLVHLFGKGMLLLQNGHFYSIVSSKRS